ncbi:gas vesicle accessory protein GvpU [Metabacillus indicus]|uniref:Gas vesicle protein GvpU n=1 Tax=Metabacillus indicus TaxID=246786 RepID=A0A084H161_METID|nr:MULTISPECIES: gas vesicle accessory protein GvpU [Metabacillus]KEZ53323.1 gas vesicle protein GvpU [Metabacillus indicus]MDX8289267.1 gas vesicle accessory protein GvpU [Metabacillus indicus]
MSTATASSKDSVLEFFVQASNKHGFALDITLNMNGAVISGTMISAKEYFDTLSETFEDGSEVAQNLSEQLSRASESIEENGSGEAHFIHLKNTKVYIGDSKSTPSKGQIIWRGKLSEVNGFFLGKISDAKPAAKKTE